MYNANFHKINNQLYLFEPNWLSGVNRFETLEYIYFHVQFFYLSILIR